jgi:hypothetical protein
MLVLASSVVAEPVAAPGDMRLRHDLQLLNDSGVINIPLTAWPVSLGDVNNAIDGVDGAGLSKSNLLALRRVTQRLSWELDVDSPDFVFGISASSEPRVIRTFENTPRAEGEASAKLAWVGERFALNLSATYVSNPLDGDEFRPDGTYVGVALGNWLLTAGWQERWFGPGNDGSLILSNNARPTPGIAIQRDNSTPFKTKWLSWMGPWTFTSFMTQLDDERETNDALLFGIRGSIRPLRGLEIGLTRTAQWCGDGRPCDLSTFGDLLLGKDNQGDNVDSEDEPGNQLGGFDIRWVLPKQIPAALYMQWIGEDGRPSGGFVGSWLRQVGLEHWGTMGGLSHRSHFELSDSMCQEGGFGFGPDKPNCAYEHHLYPTGYRYNGRAIGHSTDADTKSYSFGSTLINSVGHTWNATIRYMEINRAGAPNSRHTISPTPQEIVDVQITHDRLTDYGRFYAGIGYETLDDDVSGVSESNITGFIQWSSR